MKKCDFFSILLIPLILIFSCAGTPESKENAQEQVDAEAAPATYPVKVIEHKNSVMGEDIPTWFFMEYPAVSQLPEYEGTYVFIFSKTGPNLDELTDWTRSFPANSRISQAISSEVINIFEAAPPEDKERTRQYIEEAVKILDVAEYAGTRRQDDYWVYHESTENRGEESGKYYLYQLLYTVPKEQVYSAVDIALDYAEQKHTPETKEEEAAFDSLLQYLGSLKEE